ncbi:MAG: hypothetical protein MZU97_19445 [Bacillus subtilis]|nr:hypothetical protein [Bacillus subtilis]
MRNETIRFDSWTAAASATFYPTPIEDELLEADRSNAASYAPSARKPSKLALHGRRRTRQMIEKMHRMTQEGMESRGIKVDADDHVFYHAPVVIIVGFAARRIFGD